MLAFLIEAEGPVRLQDVPDTLEFLQEFVGGYIEGLGIPSDSLDLIAYMNEDGKAKGLPENVYASELLWKLLQPGDRIVGNVIIMAGDGQGDHINLPEDFHPVEYIYPL